MHRRLSLRTLAGLALSAALAAPAGTALAQALPQPVVQSHPTLGLKESGAGRFRWFGLHVYDARLFTPGGRFSFSEPYALALRYAREFQGSRIADTSTEEIARLGFGTEPQRAAWDAQMRKIFPDVKAGNELIGVHLPGEGTRFFYEGKPIGEIADPDFARAFFSIWLDPRTKAADLRASLLGEKR
ncbi:MAG: chalcone isomerase family protein [Burkholderiales bacterium]|jgi:hypothetical protein|nr:chalcone isomerase family protein [Burkholderiales bacterium]